MLKDFYRNIVQNVESYILPPPKMQETEKEISIIKDLLGRDVEGRKNTPLFYIYDDGTVEKKIIIE